MSFAFAARGAVSMMANGRRKARAKVTSFMCVLLRTDAPIERERDAR